MSELDQIKDEATRLAKNMPWWGWAIGGGVALGGVYYFRHSALTSGAKGVPAHPSGQNTAGAQAEYQPPDGLAMSDLAGMPFEYYDWSPAVTPGGQPGITPGPMPGPSPDPTPAPQPSPNPSPAPNPTPAPQPSPNPSPAPNPTPAPSPAPSPQPVSNPGPQVYTHTVEPYPAWDSTLSGIASHYGMSWQQLYNYGNDRSIIDSTAHQHGHYGDEYNWLFPGEVLQVPSAN